VTAGRFKGSRYTLLAVAVLLGLSSLWFAAAATEESESVTKTISQIAPVIPPAKGEQCVADTALMRTDHMKLLNHQRDETVIDGVRDKPFSLVDCVDCHAQTSAEGKPVRIDAEGQFCESCHAFAAVKIDCFSCHAAVPEQKELVGWNDHLIIDIQLASMEYFNRLMKERDNLGFAVNPRYTEHHGKTNNANQ